MPGFESDCSAGCAGGNRRRANEPMTANPPCLAALLAAGWLCGGGGAWAHDTPVVISPLPTFAHTLLEVSLTTTNPAAVIRYTLDGSEPTPEATPYANPLPLTASAEVKAVAYLDGAPGPMTRAAYVIAQKPPALVLVVTEDVGAGDLHQYGNPVHATPHLDALGRAGVRFTQAYSSGPGNAPNQYALLTGRLLPRAGLPPVIEPGTNDGLPAREWTLAEACRKAGYRTAFLGGWYLGDRPSSKPTAQGFDLFHGLYMPAEGHPLANLHENDAVLDPAPNPGRLLDQFVARASSFLEANATHPFLLVLYLPPLPAEGTSLGGAYGNRIEALDRAVGTIVQTLDHLRLRERTLLIVTSDEGPDLAAPCPRGSAGLFRDGRSTTFEGGLRIPAYAHWPGTILPATVSPALWWLPDLAPSLGAVAGFPWPADRPMDGTNRASAITGARREPTGAEQLFFHRLTGPSTNLAALRLGALKYHRSLTKTDPENPYTTAPLLFDVERDPTERFPSLPGLAAQLPVLQAAATAHLATFQPPYPQLPAESTLILNLSAVVSEDQDPAVHLRLTRSRDTLDEYYRVESSTDLRAWESVPLPTLHPQVKAISPTEEQVTFLPAGPAPAGRQVFYRLRALLP